MTVLDVISELSDYADVEVVRDGVVVSFYDGKNSIEDEFLDNVVIGVITIDNKTTILI